MKKMFVQSLLCGVLLLFMTGNVLAQVAPGCDRAADETSRVATARALLELELSNYASVINYWAEDVTYKDPFLTNAGRQEMLDYLDAMFGGTAYGFPDDRSVTIRDELIRTNPDDSMTYMATLEWSGTFGAAFFVQKGMSVIKFRPGEGCAYYHRDYYSEGDTWWNIPAWLAEITTMRNVYIAMFGLGNRCFDEDGDGYTKYAAATGCAHLLVDCNDFVAGINPGAPEIPGNGVDDDCRPITPD